MERALGMIWNINQDTLTFKPVTRVTPTLTRNFVFSFLSLPSPQHIDNQFARTNVNHSRAVEVKNFPG